MDFSGVTSDTSKQVFSAIDFILGLNIPPDEKRARIANLLSDVGNHFHGQLFAAASEVFDSTAMNTIGLNDEEGQAQRLATKIVRNYALHREIEPLVNSYYNSLLGAAEDEAFNNAVSMQKHPTLTRSIVGETCTWCESKVGTHTRPRGEDFARHRDCDCQLIVNGYNSRNGLLNNYTKG